MTALLATTLAFSSSAEAINLIGTPFFNLNFDTINSGQSGFRSQRAVGFTLPVGVGYRLDNIVLGLANYNTAAGDVALLQIYADPAKTSFSPTQATLQSVLFTNPTSFSNNDGIFTFTPTSSFTFAADTRYWLEVSATSGDYLWGTSNSTPPNNLINPPTGIAASNGYRFSINSGGYFENPFALFGSFQVNATPVPFDFSPQFGIAVLGGGWLLRKRFKKSK